MRIAPLSTVAIASLCLAACVSTAPRDEPMATYVLVRHAEKDIRVTDDPPLTTEGAARAQRLAGLLRDQPLDAIYSSPYRRTRDTAQPVASSHHLAITDYDPRDATGFATRLRRDHPRGSVLVVGHSDTLPPLARALCGCDVSDMDERIYGIRYTLRVDGAGHASLTESRD